MALLRGIITHPEGGYLREGGRTGQVYRPISGEIANLRRQIEDAGGLSVVLGRHNPAHALDSGIYVTFRPTGKTDRLKIPYASDLQLSR